MEIKQFEDKDLAHFSYAVLSNKEVIIIDPTRNPQQYFDFAKAHESKIIGVIETHSHADFVSSHLEIHKKTGATIYVSRKLDAKYPFQKFDEGSTILLGKSTLSSVNTPGHSFDSICVIMSDENEKQTTVFTGDTLLLGDCGRPDLRDTGGTNSKVKIELANLMYHSLRNHLITLSDEVIVYPAHGAGSLCGKNMSDAKRGTIGYEKKGNWSLQQMTDEKFVEKLLADQSFIPKYFHFDVELNKKGAEEFNKSIAEVKLATFINENSIKNLDQSIIKIDARAEGKFKENHINSALNIMNGGKFETWLGSIVSPNEDFYLIGDNEAELRELIARTAKIGYEKQIALAFTTNYGNSNMPKFDSNLLQCHEEDFTIIDVRSDVEFKENKIFKNALNFPLYELRERLNEIPTDKPIVVHCASGYRSAAGSSIVDSKLHGIVAVYDLGEAIKKFQKNNEH